MLCMRLLSYIPKNIRSDCVKERHTSLDHRIIILASAYEKEPSAGFSVSSGAPVTEAGVFMGAAGPAAGPANGESAAGVSTGARGVPRCDAGVELRGGVAYVRELSE